MASVSRIHPERSSDTRSKADQAHEHLEEVRRHLRFAARNMRTAFDGALGDAEANAYASLAGAEGALLDLEETIDRMGDR